MAIVGFIFGIGLFYLFIAVLFGVGATGAAAYRHRRKLGGGAKALTGLAFSVIGGIGTAAIGYRVISDSSLDATILFILIACFLAFVAGLSMLRKSDGDGENSFR